MSALAPTRQALWITVAAACCLLGCVLGLLVPPLATALLACAILATALIAALVARNRLGLDRFGWACIATAAALLAVVQVCAPDRWSMPATGTVVAMTLGGVGLLAFSARSAGELVSAVLQWSTLTTTALIGVWLLCEPTAVRLADTPRHHATLVADLALILSAVATIEATLGALARHGRNRLAFAAIACGCAIGTVATGLAWLDRATPDDPHAAHLLRMPQAWLILLGALIALSAGRPGLRRALLDHTRDLTVISVITLLVVVGALLGRSGAGFDHTLSRALAALVCLLVCTHIYEARRHRSLTRSVEEQERHMRLLVSESRDIIIELDREGRLVFASEAIRNILGLRFNQLVGHPISEVIPELDDATLAHVVHAPKARIQPTMRVESVLTTSMGSVVHAESVVTPLARGYLVAVRDVSERVGLQSRLRQVTYHDTATGLPNRASLGIAIRHRLYEAAEIGLVLVDLNPAGPSDNTVGDESHEELLRAVGRTLQSLVRPGDVVSRFSDHRFAVLLRAGTSSADALAEAERLVGRINDGEQLTDSDLMACASVAVGGHSGAEIIRNAELALRQAQLAGGGAVRLFEPPMLAQFARTRDLRRRLALTPDTDRWTVLYQPVINLQTGRTQGVEALLRWTDPEGDFIGIEEIIRLAEEFGSIIQIGSWVLDQAAAQAARWERTGRPLQVAVNVSVHQLTAPGFAQVVEEVLERHSLTPALLTLEITETVVLEQTDETIATLSELRELGVRIAIDDFGTGYSGLANIRSLPLDILKIDRMFIQGLGQGGSDEAVVNAVTHLGLELGLAITAEGIETPEQERLARALGITAAQGYLYARPLPAADVTALVARSDASADAVH